MKWDTLWHANDRRVEDERGRAIAIATTAELAEQIVCEHEAASAPLDAVARGCVCHSPKEPSDDHSNRTAH